MNYMPPLSACVVEDFYTSAFLICFVIFFMWQYVTVCFYPCNPIK